MPPKRGFPAPGPGRLTISRRPGTDVRPRPFKRRPQRRTSADLSLEAARRPALPRPRSAYTLYERARGSGSESLYDRRARRLRGGRRRPRRAGPRAAGGHRRRLRGGPRPTRRLRRGHAAPSLPHHAPLAPLGREDADAAEARQRLLPHRLRRARGGPGRRRAALAARPRLVLRLLPRPLHGALARDDPARGAPGPPRQGRRPQLGRAADGRALRPPRQARDDDELVGRRPVPPRARLCDGGAAAGRGRLRLRLLRRGGHEPGRLPRSAQLGLPHPRPRALLRPGQQVRDLGPRPGPDRRRHPLQARRRLRGPQADARGRDRLL